MRHSVVAVIATLSLMLMAGCGSNKESTADPSTPSAASSSSGSPASGSPCDQFLDDYESYVDSYIAFMKEYKSNPSDLSLLTRYTEMMQKLNEMAERSKECEGDDMSTTRLLKIQTKLTQAAQEM